MNKYKGSYKHVFHIGDEGDMKSASPLVFLDETENKLYVRFGAVENDTFTGDLKTVQNLSEVNKTNLMKQGIVLDYIPIQRWVHIGIVVNENSNRGTITAYVDGDLTKIVSTDEDYNIKNLNLDKMGDLHTGGSFESTSGPGFSGLISKITMFNYDINTKDMYDDYNRGPLDGLLAALGLSNYGLRTPIYAIE